MPLVGSSSYRAPFWMKGGHLQTIYPALFRRQTPPPLERLSLDTRDGDFFEADLGRAEPHNHKIIIISHGLEGHSRRAYVQGLGKAFMRAGWDMLARNCRFCGEEPNRLPRLYHSGETDDLEDAIGWCLKAGYGSILLAGFSMGGNQTLKYLGERADSLPKEVLGAIAISVPCDLAGSARALSRPGNRLYMANFMQTLRQKIRVKHSQFPALFPMDNLARMKTFKQFDDCYTAPLHGFKSAEDYWEKSGCLAVLPALRVPALLVNARNDPFMSDSCFPEEVARDSRRLYLEMPSEGGHVGFAPACRGETAGPEGYWYDNRALEFVRALWPKI